MADLEGRALRVETPCGDGSLVWRVWGNGPPVVLTHGSAGAWWHWIRNVLALAQHRTVWALDLPGHGASAMPPREDAGAIADVIAAGLRRNFGAGAPVDIVGFSLGGVLAAHAARFHPDVVRRLILLGTGGLDTPVGHVDLRRVRGLEGEERRAVLKSNLLGLMLHDPAAVDDLAMHLQVISRSQMKAAPLVLPDKLLRSLAEVSCQVDAIWGEHDRPHPDPALQEQALRRSHPKADFRVIKGSGHWVMYERPEETTRAVLDMLAQPLRR